jgi:hypothetical protein
MYAILSLTNSTLLTADMILLCTKKPVPTIKKIGLPKELLFSSYGKFSKFLSQTEKSLLHMPSTIKQYCAVRADCGMQEKQSNGKYSCTLLHITIKAYFFSQIMKTLWNISNI